MWQTLFIDVRPEDMPIHNVIGTDANMLMDMKNSLSQEEFLQKMSEMLIPE